MQIVDAIASMKKTKQEQDNIDVSPVRGQLVDTPSCVTPDQKGERHSLRWMTRSPSFSPAGEVLQTIREQVAQALGHRFDGRGVHQGAVQGFVTTARHFVTKSKGLHEVWKNMMKERLDAGFTRNIAKVLKDLKLKRTELEQQDYVEGDVPEILLLLKNQIPVTQALLDFV